jgi:hypothetical protein
MRKEILQEETIGPFAPKVPPSHRVKPKATNMTIPAIGKKAWEIVAKNTPGMIVMLFLAACFLVFQERLVGDFREALQTHDELLMKSFDDQAETMRMIQKEGHDQGRWMGDIWRKGQEDNAKITAILQKSLDKQPEVIEQLSSSIREFANIQAKDSAMIETLIKELGKKD